jgi:uncharacterized cupin superfamily protein
VTVPEAPLEQSKCALAANGERWFVLNAREAHWRRRQGRGYSLPFEGKMDLPQLGVELYVLGPGEPIGMYHWEANQEDFLVLSGKGSCSSRGKSGRCGSGTSRAASAPG